MAMPPAPPDLKHFALFDAQGEPGHLLKAMANPRFLGMVALGILIVVLGIGLLVIPSIREMQRLDQQLAIKQKQLQQKKLAFAEFKSELKNLLNLPSGLRPVRREESPAVVAAAMRQHIENIARGGGKGVTRLPEPHNVRTLVDLTARGETREKYQPGDDELPTIVFRRFRYDATVRGTYASLADFINRLVKDPSLVVIDKMVIQQQKEAGPVPDYALEPDYPVPLDMVISFSIYLQETHEQLDFVPPAQAFTEDDAVETDTSTEKANDNDNPQASAKTIEDLLAPAPPDRTSPQKSSQSTEPVANGSRSRIKTP